MKILFFSPNSFILEHSIPETILVKELLNSGHEVHRLLCDSLFKTLCTAMESANISFNSSISEKNDICLKCRSISKSIKQVSKANHHDISFFITQVEKELIDEYIDSLDIESFKFEDDYFLSKDLKFKAAYETILKFKLNKLCFNVTSFSFYKAKLRSALYSYYVGKNFKSFLKADILFIYSPQYEINNFFYEGYKSKTLKTFFIEGSENIYFHYSGLRVWDWDINKLVSPLKNNWDKIDFKKIPSSQNFLVYKHLDELYKSNSFRVFSPKKIGKVIFANNFDPSKFKKTFLLCLSSSDEAFAAFTIGAFPENKVKSEIFTSQIEWLEYTMRFFMNYDDYALIVRIHPRETHLKNGSVVSNHFNEIQNNLKSYNLSENIYINYPSDNISLYDLFSIIDVTLVSWSLTGIESLLHSKPVIVYDNNLTNYPDEIVFTGNSLDEYRENLKMFLELKPKLHNKILYDLGFNWLKVNFYLNNIYFKTKGVSFKVILIILKISRKIDNYRFYVFIFIFTYNILKLDDFSRKRFLELVSHKKNDLLNLDSIQKFEFNIPRKIDQ